MLQTLPQEQCATNERVKEQIAFNCFDIEVVQGLHREEESAHGGRIDQDAECVQALR